MCTCGVHHNYNYVCDWCVWCMYDNYVQLGVHTIFVTCVCVCGACMKCMCGCGVL